MLELSEDRVHELTNHVSEDMDDLVSREELVYLVKYWSVRSSLAYQRGHSDQMDKVIEQLKKLNEREAE
jgi:hypothetical protein